MCDCIKTVNEKLAPENTRVLQPLMVFNNADVSKMCFVETERIETGRGKKKAIALFATFCPFCGEKIDNEGPKQTVN